MEPIDQSQSPPQAAKPPPSPRRSSTPLRTTAGTSTTTSSRSRTPTRSTSTDTGTGTSSGAATGTSLSSSTDRTTPTSPSPVAAPPTNRSPSPVAAPGSTSPSTIKRPYALYANQVKREYKSPKNSSFSASNKTTKVSNINVNMNNNMPVSWKNLKQKSFALEKIGQGLNRTLIDMQKKKSQKNANSRNNGMSRHERNMITQQSLPTLKSKQQEQNLYQHLDIFTTRHMSHHRPIVLVTSGGTATDLEVHMVRYLDNFSTGTRGAVSVEEFVKRGYAVIHLWREGSAAPFSRVLSELVGCKSGNHGLGFDALGHLFEGQEQQQQHEMPEYEIGSGEESQSYSRSNDNNVNNQNNNDDGDPWLTTTKRSKSADMRGTNNQATHASKIAGTNPEKNKHNPNSINDEYSNSNRMNLTNKILNSTTLQMKLRERSNVMKDGLLLTIPYRTVEEYMAKLKVCTKAINKCQSLGLIYLAAAVSDFYIPEKEKRVHKIQSRYYNLNREDGDNDVHDDHDGPSESAIFMDSSTNELTIKMKPVPKVIPLIREEWAPHAFCISFKLETDESILFQKAKMAMNKYDVHMVIGNVLETRYDKIWLLNKTNKVDYTSTANDFEDGIVQKQASNDSTNSDNSYSQDYYDVQITEVTKTNRSSISTSTSSKDQLESNMISHVVEKHFEYISNHFLIDGDENDDNGIGTSMEDDTSTNTSNFLPRTALMAGAEAAARHSAIMRERQEKMQKELYWKRVKDMSMNIAGQALGCYLTFALSSAVQTRMR
mmetsp:Transcript_26824/g.30702  ORF Transcript_26824/g.30702 Transcript_26824/m.30702 type:complete len:772 (-) Transcript_26824:292-2607(-)